MKKIVFTLAIVITSAALGFSQNALRCNSPISNLVFQQKVNEINMQRVELRKLQVAKEIATNNCLSSSQVRQIAQMFTDDFNRLDFSMAAYANVFDKDNFYEVYDAFERFSNVFRLHDYTLAYQPLPPKSHTHQPAQPADVVMEIIFPEYNYPVCLHYSGMTGCNPPIRDNELRQLAGQLRNQPSEATKMAIATQLVLNNCLTTEHVMKLASMLENESQRLNFLKQSFPHVYDQQNYMAGEQLFSNEGLRQAFIAFVNSKLVVVEVHELPPPPPPVDVYEPCEVSDQEFLQVRAAINSETFSSTKKTVARQAISAKECFTAHQIKGLVDLFTFENDKLEMAKFAYDYCIDQDNYYVLFESFTYNSSKEELQEYIGQ